MKKYLLFLFMFLHVQLSVAQQDLYIGTEIVGGTLGSTDLESDLLNKKNYSPIIGAQLNINFRLFDFIAFEGGLGQYRSRIRLEDAAFANELDGFSIHIKNTNYHWNYYAAVSTYYKIGSTDTYIYGKFSISKNFYKEAQISKSESFEVSSQNINRSLVYTSNYNGSNISYIPELGLQHKFFKGNLLSIGFRYNLGQSKMLESEYTVTDNYTQEIKTDFLKSVGNAFAINFRFDYKLIHFAKREKVKKLKPNDIALDVTKKDVMVMDTVVVDVEPDTATPVAVANRDLIIKEKVTVRSAKVKIVIWDHQTVDGDRVSLNLNGNWVLEDYELVKEPYEMELELKEGTNTFVLHALNLGNYKPNTAALLVYDGNRKHRIILESSLKESGTLQINYKKDKNESK